MHLISNSITPNDVEQTTRQGDDYLIVKDVPFIRAMSLSGGYVPEREIKATVNQWQGQPLTANHPRNENGKPVPANTKLNEVGVGKAENPRYDGTWVRADLAINADRARAMGGTAADIVQKIKNGEKFDVSSQYVPKQLPAGQYDGEHRANVEGIEQPDSIALLPHKPGKCSIEDGCGINPQMAANAAVHVPMTQNATHDGEDMDAAAKHFSAGALVEWQTGDATAQGRVIEAFTEPGKVTRTFDGTEVTREVTEDEGAYLVEAWDGDEFNEDKRALKAGNNVSEWSDPPEAAMRANAVPYEATNVTPEDVDEFTDREWDGSDAVAGMPNPSEDEDAPDILDQTHAAVPADDEARDSKANWKLPFRTGPDAPVNTRALVAIDAALDGARGGVEGLSDEVRGDISEWVNSMLSEAPDDLFGAGEDMEANTLVDRFFDWVTGGSTANSEETTGAATDTGSDTPAGSGSTTDMDRGDLISEIVANSKLSKEALAERCDDGLEAIHADVTDNTDMSDNNDNGDKIVFDSQEEFEERVEEIVANRQEQSTKEELATEIVANSADYEDKESVLEDYPTEAALEAKKDNLESGGATMPAGGITGNGVEIEANDNEFDVSGGVLTND